MENNGFLGFGICLIRYWGFGGGLSGPYLEDLGGSFRLFLIQFGRFVGRFVSGFLKVFFFRRSLFRMFFLLHIVTGVLLTTGRGYW